MQEAAHGGVERVRAGVDVGAADRGGERNLLDRLARAVDGELDEREHLLGAADVGAGVLAERLQQLVAVAQQLRDAELRAGLAQEVVLAGGADEVVVAVAVADVVQRVAAAQALVAGLDVDRRVVGGRGADVAVEVVAVDVGVHAVEPVHERAEAGEVDVDDVVDPDPEHVLQRLDRERGTAPGVRGVELRGALARDRDLEVARDREHGDGLGPRAEADEHHRVRARVALRGRRAMIGADQQDRPRLAAAAAGARGARPRRRGRCAAEPRGRARSRAARWRRRRRRRRRSRRRRSRTRPAGGRARRGWREARASRVLSPCRRDAAELESDTSQST